MAKEYIEREKMLLQVDLHGTNKFGMLDEDIREFIKKQPAADVVEVVRCRDCKYNDDNGGGCNRTITHTSRNLICEINEYKYVGLEYCSYGERKEQ